jgi:hypothetical protein
MVLVAGVPVWDLLFRAKHLFPAANDRRGRSKRGSLKKIWVTHRQARPQGRYVIGVRHALAIPQMGG